MQKNWSTIFPEVPFDPVFLDDHLNTLYQNDIRFANLVNVFSGVTIIIAILGLYSLISIIYEYRVKEVGVRKVLGASWQSISITLSRPFILLIALANIVAWPFSYYVIDRWISMFAYHTNIRWEYFPGVLGLTLLVSTITLLTQTRKISGLNPAHVLQNE